MSNQHTNRNLINTIVFPIVISTPFAVGDVFCYLIKDEKNVLIDCGHKSDSSHRQLKAALHEHGLKIEDIDEIWLTHGHPDHFGQAALLAGQSGAVVKGHAKERANFAARDSSDLFEDFFSDHDISPKIIKRMIEQLDWLQQFQEPLVPDWVKEGESLRSGRLHFTIKHTPGHASGHIVFYSETGLIFGGDVLLEHISTNALINFDPDTGTRNKSLMQYRHTLQWMQKQQGLVLPGHGKQITDIRKVGSYHLSEQDKRYEQIKNELQKQPQELMQLSKTIFRDALQDGEYFLVFSEIIGYLDWGEREGIITKDETEDGIQFMMK